VCASPNEIILDAVVLTVNQRVLIYSLFILLRTYTYFRAEFAGLRDKLLCVGVFPLTISLDSILQAALKWKCK
jgi:hypothetical protein